MGGGAKGRGRLWLLFARSTGFSGRSCVGTLKSQGKPFEISKWEVWEAFRQVKAKHRLYCPGRSAEPPWVRTSVAEVGLRCLTVPNSRRKVPTACGGL